MNGDRRAVGPRIVEMTARLAGRGPEVSRICLGTSPLGGAPGHYGYDVTADRAVATVHRFLGSPFNFIDTANGYGNGDAERRVGIALRQAPAPRSTDVVIATKVDPCPGSRVLDGERVRRSLAESLERLGVPRVDVLYLHDPEHFDPEYLNGPGGAVEALRELRSSDTVGLIGVAGGSVPVLCRYLDTGVFDVVLNHNRFTLLDRSAEPLIDRAVAAGVAFVNAAPYASGILAKPLGERPRYRYEHPAPAVIERVGWLHAVCGEFGVPLPAVALRFSTRDPRIASTVVGVSSPDRVDALARYAAADIPDELWRVLDATDPAPAP